MNKEALYELAAKWKSDATVLENEVKDADESAAHSNGVRDGMVLAKFQCADDLKLLIRLIG